MNEPTQTRRGILALTGALTVAGLGTAGNALSQTTDASSNHDDWITFGEINTEGEWLVLHNEGDEDLDITGYTIVFGFEEEQDHTKQFEEKYGATMIPAGGSITVATGAPASQDGTPAEDPDVEFDFGTAKMPDDGSDVYAILDPEGNEVARSDEDRHGTDGDETTTTTEEEEQDDEEQEDEEEGEEEDGLDVDLPKEYHADLSGVAETHDVETDATGTATFEVNEDGTQASYTLSVTDLCNITQAHIHLGEEGEDGPVVVWLYPEGGQEPELIDGPTTGTIAESVITEDDLVGEWEGASFEDVIATFEDQGAYVNVHTEAYPAGEIRGQITAQDG